jgi:phospholipid/cholesterol/gamma-HCH transport system substrate-binding protein
LPVIRQWRLLVPANQPNGTLVKRAIATHRTDFAAIAAMVVAAVAVTVYILKHQPAFVFGQKYYTVKAEFQTAAAVTAGQGQAVTIAGVQIGQVGGVSLVGGHAVVTMNIYKRYAPIYRDATVLLRPRTPLKDMYLALDPGNRSAGAIPAGGTISTANTDPDVDVSQILSSLDADSRDYLLLLLSGGAEAFQDHGSTAEAPSPAAVSGLRQTLKRFAPLDRDTASFTSLLAQRQANIHRAIHNLNLVANALGDVEDQLTSLISSSDTNFAAISANDTQLEQALSEFPATLQQQASTFTKVRAFSAASATTLQELKPFAQNLGPALRASRPLFRDTTPVIEHQLRPFSQAVQPLARLLAPGAAKLAKATPALSSAVSELNKLFDTLAYQPSGSEQGYLFWGSWLAHIADSLTSAQDANGAVLHGLFMGTCDELNFFEGQLEPFTGPVGVILDLLNPPVASQLPGATAIPGSTSVNCPQNG